MKKLFEQWLLSQKSEMQIAGADYISECEHQDGEEYWDDQFTTLAQIIKDFMIYWELA